jgi:Skp family chaperone for outer membrane proteins
MTFLLLALSLQLQVSPAVPVAIVNVPRLVAESMAGKAATAQLHALQAEKEKAISDKQAILSGLNQSRALTAQIERAQIELQRFTEDAKQDLATLDRELQAAFDQKLQQALNKIGEREHIGVIFEYPQQMIVWVVPALDITTKVIEQLDAAMTDEKK